MIATTRPSPTHTSDAATAITASAKIWPAPLCQWRENAISARLPPFSMISSESSTISGLRRMSTPSAPIPNRKAATREVPGDARAVHQTVALFVCEPRITPPTAATSRTIDVISNASR